MVPNKQGNSALHLASQNIHGTLHRYTQTVKDPMRTSKLRYKWNFLNGLMFQPTVAWDVFKMDMRYLSLKKLQVQPHVSRSR